MSWLNKIFGKKPIQETYSAPKISDAKEQEIWIVYWDAFQYEFINSAKVLRKFKVFHNKLDAELYKEQIDIANELLGNICRNSAEIEKQD